MKKQLQKLRERPEHQKHRIAKILALCTTILITIIWLSFFAFRLDSHEKLPATENILLDTIGDIATKGVLEFSEVQEELSKQISFSEILKKKEIKDELSLDMNKDYETEQ